MSHARNKVEWCLKKAEKELEAGKKHRGLLIIMPSTEKANEHIAKAEHYLFASDFLKKGGFSDISASTLFYAMYHCLLAIAAKHGYESRNQECTFALVRYLIDSGRIQFGKALIDKAASFDLKNEDMTSIEIREKYQYGTSLSLKENLYKEMYMLAKQVIAETKTAIAES
ncbi:MAG: hypothetical protein KJ955_07610 [Nanoarchaeota archaeon]|nr:hypothetical protein [Nanoarchaeota archaeon]